MSREQHMVMELISLPMQVRGTDIRDLMLEQVNE